MDSIPEEVIEEMCQLVKANSIEVPIPSTPLAQHTDI
jgi:hypothetical protein